MEMQSDGSEDIFTRMREKISLYAVPLLLGGMSLLFLCIAGVMMLQLARPVSPIQFINQKSSSSSAQIAIDIQGAVVAPGVYYLPVGSRVEDALRMAGGMRDDADESYIAKSLNRASVLRDGVKIYIPTSGEGIQSVTSHNYESVSRSESTSYNDYSQVSVNGASAAELEALPGVGPVTAGKIISGRPYSSIDELVTKKIVSENLFEKLKNLLTL